MADLDPKTATLRQVAEAYAEKSGRGKSFMGPALQYFRDIADEPGSALRLFEKDADGVTLLSKTFKGTEDTSTVKTAMQNLRQVGLTLKEMVGPDTPEYKLFPDKSPNTDLNNRIFGRSEPAKAVSEVAINPDKKKMSQLFAGVSKYLDDPKTRPIAQAIIFNLNTGLRPNAAAGLQMSAYKPDSGAIYIEAETKGAKGRPVNIPLNPLADSILQENLAKGNKNNFFVKQNGKVVTSKDMSDLLKEVKVPDIAFDAATGRYFDTLNPSGFTGKKGAALLRNVHATVGQSIGIDQDRLAYLQGRSLKSAGKSSTGELTTYQQAFPGAVGEVDRTNANMFASFWGDAAQEAGFEVTDRIPLPTERITTSTAGYEGYFDLPVREEVPAPKPVTPVDETIPTSDPEARASLERRGFDAKGMAAAINKHLGKLPGPVKKALGPVGVGLTAVTAATTAREVEAATGSATLGAIAGASEFGPMGYSDVRDLGAARAAPDTFGLTPASRIAAEEDAGFIDLGRNREPETSPAPEEGFVTR
jgi:integrase